MEVAAALSRRRMVRRYTAEPIDPDHLRAIARAGLRAPSAGNSQGVRLVVTTDPVQRRAVAECADEKRWVAAGKPAWLSGAPAHIIVFVDPTAYEDRYAEADKAASEARSEDGSWPVPWWWVDAGASLMAILLAAVDNGLAAGFLGGHAFEGLSEAVGAPDAFELVGVVTVGHAHPEDAHTGSALRPRSPIEDRLRYDRWDAS